MKLGMVFNPRAKTPLDKSHPLILLGGGIGLYMEFAILVFNLPFYASGYFNKKKLIPKVYSSAPVEQVQGTSTKLATSISSTLLSRTVAEPALPMRRAVPEATAQSTRLLATLQVREDVLQEIRRTLHSVAPSVAAPAAPSVNRAVSPARPNMAPVAAPSMRRAVPACPLPNAPAVAPAVPLRRSFRGVSTRVTRITATLLGQQESLQDRRRRLAEMYCR